MLKTNNFLITLTLLCSTTCISIAFAASAAPQDQVNTFVQEMLTYFKDHPISDTVSIQDILGQVEKNGGGEQALKASASDTAAVSGKAGGHADISLKKAAPADNSIALAVGVPASAAAAAAMPPNMIPPVQKLAVVGPAAPIPPIAAQAPAEPVFEAPIIPVTSVEPIQSAAASPSAAEPMILNPHVIGNAVITPVTTYYASVPSITVTPTDTTTVVSSSVPPPTGSLTHSSSMMSTTSTHTTSSSTRPTSSPTVTIPPISSGNKNDARIALWVSLVGLVSLFYHF